MSNFLLIGDGSAWMGLKGCSVVHKLVMSVIIDNDVKLTSQIECFASQTKVVDVDDDGEYMNGAAAHAAFVVSVSAAKMYWLLRHA